MAANTATSPAIDSDALITMNVRMLLARDDVHVTDVEQAIGIKSSTFYRRFESGGWKAAEVARIALHFGVPVAALYEDPRIGGPYTRQKVDHLCMDTFTPLAA
jgi:hypothetical protein